MCLVEQTFHVRNQERSQVTENDMRRREVAKLSDKRPLRTGPTHTISCLEDTHQFKCFDHVKSRILNENNILTNSFL